jgi:hypothetical protein
VCSFLRYAILLRLKASPAHPAPGVRKEKAAFSFLAHPTELQTLNTAQSLTFN